MAFHKPIRSSLIAILLCSCGSAFSQDKASTEQKPEWKTYYARLDSFRSRGTAALEAELAREKAGDCPNAQSTYEINMCLTAEMKTTQSNYEAYVRAIGGLLRAPTPSSVPANPKDPSTGYRKGARHSGSSLGRL